MPLVLSGAAGGSGALHGLRRACAGGGRVNVLTDLAQAMERAAEALGKGNPFQRAWSRHLLVDRKAMLMLAVTWREPSSVYADPVD
jgi:hypothetical protein